MKPTTPHDPFDDLIVAALHGELTPEERTQFDARLSNDPAAQAAYQKAKLMHDLLEKTHKNAQPDPAFEQRMVSGVRRKIQHEQQRETAWESALVLWRALTSFPKRPRLIQITVALAIVAILAAILFPATTASLNSAKRARMLADSGIADPASTYQPQRAEVAAQLAQVDAAKTEAKETSRNLEEVDQLQKTISNKITINNGSAIAMGGATDADGAALALRGGNTYTGGTTVVAGSLTVNRDGFSNGTDAPASTASASSIMSAAQPALPAAPMEAAPSTPVPTVTTSPAQVVAYNEPDATKGTAWNANWKKQAGEDQRRKDESSDKIAKLDDLEKASSQAKTLVATGSVALPGGAPADTSSPVAPGTAGHAGTAGLAGEIAAAPAIDMRKLIRNAQLDLEVKSYQAAMDQITALTKSAGGYVDTSNSQKGGNGKLQGTVVVKVLPQNLDAFLLKLRDLGELQNQSVSTDDVTKAYFDTQARLENSRRMEAQLQDLLKKTNGKVSELLQVERELGRVRGDIEQMQGQLKLYDFQVQFATITIQMREKDLNQTAAYLLKEQDQFSLFASDVEGTFQQARHTADQFKAQILAANLNHESGSNVSAELTIMVAPDQIEAFLTQLRGLGRVANFTRQTQRVAKDGGDTDQPADQTLTEKDKVQVGITIRSDDESRKQVALTVVASAVDTALDEAKTAALANDGAEILSSSLNKTAQGQSTARLSVRVPGKYYHQLLDTYRALGRTASFSLQRDDNSGPGANGDDAPVIVSLSLTDTDMPLQVTEMSVLGTDVDSQAQQLKKDAATAGVQVTGSNFQRDPNGMEIAQMVFRMPMAKYPAFVETLKKLGHVESLTVQRQDRPDQTRSDDTAPVEIGLRLHSQGDIVAEDTGFWATLRQTFGEGAGALFGSVRVIGVLIAFAVPWIFAIGVIAWIGRRIYVWKKK